MPKPYQLPDEQLQLPQGYIIMERSRDYILAFNPDSTINRYATWQIAQGGILVNGNYFSSPISAGIDFKTRVDFNL